MSDRAATPSSAGTSSAPALSVDHLSKRFGDRIAFDDVSFEVGQGEVFGFLGPNGAGKTTTVRTLGTLIARTSGSARVAGIPLTPENDRNRSQRDACRREVLGRIPAAALNPQTCRRWNRLARVGSERVKRRGAGRQAVPARLGFAVKQRAL